MIQNFKRVALAAKNYLDWGRLPLAFLLGSTLVAQAQTQTAFTCNTNSFLFQGTPTIGYLLDFASGATTAQGTNNGNNGNIYTTSTLNAFGYNPVDGYIWSQLNGQNQLVRVGTEFVGKTYNYTPPTSTVPTTFTVGDIDVTGRMYLTRGGSAEGRNNANTDIYMINLNQQTTPLAMTVMSSTGNTFLTDWAVSPKDTCLYAINTYFADGSGGSTNQNATTIYRFVTHNRRFNNVSTLAGTREVLGTATGGSTPIAAANFSAAFMDSNGSLYVVAAATGLVHRIDRPDLLANNATTSIPATYLGKVTSGNGGNVDGARCAFSKPAAGALPVTLTAFTAVAAPNRRVQLAWTTASEANNAYFEVQHSLDGHAFAAVGQVAGHQTTTQTSTYAFVDASPGSEATHYYRLRQVDLDGTSNFSPVRVVNLAAGSSPVQLAVAPNPTTPDNLRVQVQYAGTEAAPAMLTVQSLLGQTLFAQSVTVQPGANVLMPNLKLAPGAYWLSLNGSAALGQQGVRVLVGN